MPQRIIIEVNNWFKRDRIVRNLELFQDIIVISLCVSLFCVMLIRLGDMFLSFFIEETPKPIYIDKNSNFKMIFK